MKINNQDLRQIYQFYIEAKTADSRIECPALETMIESFDRTSSNKKKEAIIAHLCSCSHCAREFDFIRQILDHEQQLAEKLQDIRRPAGTRFFSRPWSVRTYASVLFIAVVLTSAVLFFKSAWRGAGTQRGQASSLKLIRPLDETESSAAPIFEWTTLPGSIQYVVEIYDEALRPVWTSPRVPVNRLVLPPLIKMKLAVHKSYFWTVTAYGPYGKFGESALRSFSLAD